jgi:primosomal protein N''
MSEFTQDLHALWENAAFSWEDETLRARFWFGLWTINGLLLMGALQELYSSMTTFRTGKIVSEGHGLTTLLRVL